MVTKKQIINWCLITLCGLLAITLFTFLMLGIFCPLSLAKMSGELGFDKLELSFYKRDVKIHNDINSIYKVVLNSNNMKNYKDVEVYYEKLENHKEYSNFIEYANENNLKIDATNLNKSVLLNEDNYLKNRYILALINNGKLDKAFNYACQNFMNYKNYTLKNGGTYLFYNLVQLRNDELNSKFLENNGFDDTLFNVLVEYINLSLLQYDEGFENFIESDSIYLLALNTRIKQVYVNINTLCTELNIVEPENLYTRVKSANDKAVELL